MPVATLFLRFRKCTRRDRRGESRLSSMKFCIRPARRRPESAAILFEIGPPRLCLWAGIDPMPPPACLRGLVGTMNGRRDREQRGSERYCKRRLLGSAFLRAEARASPAARPCPDESARAVIFDALLPTAIETASKAVGGDRHFSGQTTCRARRRFFHPVLLSATRWPSGGSTARCGLAGCGAKCLSPEGAHGCRINSR